MHSLPAADRTPDWTDWPAGAAPVLAPLSRTARPRGRTADRPHGRPASASAGPEIAIVAVGRVRHGPVRSLIDGYLERIAWRITEHEVSLTGRVAESDRPDQEAALIMAAVPAGSTLVSLDPTGTSLTSEAFADRVRQFRDEGQAIAFAIGGAEGHGEAVTRSAVTRIAFGPMTWPHELARVMLAEQLWRAHAILTGHPYHRCG